jgi:hypothetical protein
VESRAGSIYIQCPLDLQLGFLLMVWYVEYLVILELMQAKNPDLKQVSRYSKYSVYGSRSTKNKVV